MFKRSNILYYIGIFFSLTVFVLYCLIASCNRYQTDDLYFSALINKDGLMSTLKFVFYNWEFNLISVLYYVCLQGFQDINLLYLNSPIYLSNVLCLWFMINKLLHLVNIQMKYNQTFVIAACFIAILYLSLRAGSGVTFWITAQIVYLIPLNFLLMGIAFWYSDERGISIPAACLFLFLFAHSRVNYDLCFFSVYVLLAIVRFFQSKKFSISAHLPFVFFLVGFFSYLIIPGCYRRFAFHNGNDIDSSQVVSYFFYVKSIFIGVVHFYKMSISNLGFWFAFLVSFLAGMNYRTLVSDRIKANFRGWIVLFFVAFNVALLANILVTLIALKTPIGYGRIFVFLEFLFLSFIVLSGLMIGTFLNFRWKTKSLIFFAFLSVTCLIINKGATKLNTALMFVKQHDERIAKLDCLKRDNFRGKVYLSPLQGCDVLGYQDIGVEDTLTKITPYPNRSIQDYYSLPFQIFLKR
jgi:hypothetical protein